MSEARVGSGCADLAGWRIGTAERWLLNAIGRGKVPVDFRGNLGVELRSQPQTATMKEISDQIYAFFYEKISLQTMGLVVGLLVLGAHLWALLRPVATQEFLKKLPRNQGVGTWVMTLVFVWAMVVATSMDLGEFARLRWLAQFALPAMFLSMLFYTNDYLGARSVGMLACLAACPVLDAAFLKEPQSRALLALLCYVWILLGLFWIGMPYTMRDQINWVVKTTGRWRAACLGGVAYGAVLVVCALLFWKGA